MQGEDKFNISDFRETFNKIDHFYHVKEFKSLSESKRIHFKADKGLPSDYYVQMRKLFLHMIYLYYIAHVKKVNLYLYPHYCINKWGVIYIYYSLIEPEQKFMDLVEYEDFKENLRKLFVDIWKIKKPQEKDEQERQNEENQTNSHHGKKAKSLWREFADQFVEIYDEKNISKMTPKDIISRLQETKHMKNNILIVGVLSSTIFPCIRFNKTVEKMFQQICLDEPFVVSQIFTPQFESEGKKQFMNNLIKFFKVLNDYKVLGITTTISDKQGSKSQDKESLLTEFRLTLGRALREKKESFQEASEPMEEKNPLESSNKSSENDYSQGTEVRDLGQLKCQYFWSSRMEPKELTFRVSVFINKKVYPLYFREIQSLWYKLSEKWKVILDETKQLSGFNPGFVMLSYDKDNYQLSFTEYIKCQPIQNSVSELIVTTDKLIIAALIMREIICFYEKKSLSVEIVNEDFEMNDGKLEDMARSICQCIKNYYQYCKHVISAIANIKAL